MRTQGRTPVHIERIRRKGPEVLELVRKRLAAQEVAVPFPEPAVAAGDIGWQGAGQRSVARKGSWGLKTLGQTRHGCRGGSGVGGDIRAYALDGIGRGVEAVQGLRKVGEGYHQRVLGLGGDGCSALELLELDRVGVADGPPRRPVRA